MAHAPSKDVHSSPSHKKSLDIVHVTLSKKRVNKLDSHTMEHMMYDLIYITLQSASVLFNEYLII